MIHYIENDYLKIGVKEAGAELTSVVSKETGRISIAVKGELFYNLSIDDVRMMLIDELRPKQEEDYLDELEETIAALKDGKHLGRTIVKVQ